MKEDCEIRPKAERLLGSRARIVGLNRDLWSIFCNSILDNDYDERWEIGGIRRAGPSGLLKVCGRTWGYGENKQGLHIACVSSNDSATDI